MVYQQIKLGTSVIPLFRVCFLTEEPMLDFKRSISRSTIKNVIKKLETRVIHLLNLGTHSFLPFQVIIWRRIIVEWALV